MSYHIYFPRDLLKSLKNRTDDLVLLGYKYNDTFVCCALAPSTMESRILAIQSCKSISEIQIIGSTTSKGFFHISYDEKSKLPLVIADCPSTIILFRPPNYRNLEYFSINPILLQSMGINDTDPVSDRLIEKFNTAFNITRDNVFIPEQIILDKINTVLKSRVQISQILHHGPHISQNRFSRALKSLIFCILSFFVLTVQNITVRVIRVINYQINGISLVELSQTFRQLDLRLKQVTYFPVQFLCYYDKSILYKDQSVLLKELGLPTFNSNLNINNSNYINLYNSIWLIINDVMLGLTTWNLLYGYSLIITEFLNEYIFELLLFSDLHRLISWISYHHPAGFKLNNELGSFIGELLLWSLTWWKMTIKQTILSQTNKRISVILIYILSHLGFSFLVAFVIDILNLITIHIIWFYSTSAKVYQRQVDVIKSLFQLFRGKKYNVLRNRVDNLDNYSQPSQFFEIDQLLLGTLLFITLVLLLPTIFAFYLTFFIIRLSNILVLNLFENLLIMTNFVPLFVILLKLKNSSRLQGGITFQLLEQKNHDCTYLEMANLSLTYSEIFENFAALFKRVKNFRTSIFTSFFKGNLIGLNHDHSLKFHYLMLPDNIEKSIEIWNYFSNSK